MSLHDEILVDIFLTLFSMLILAYGAMLHLIVLRPILNILPDIIIVINTRRNSNDVDALHDSLERGSFL